MKLILRTPGDIVATGRFSEMDIIQGRTYFYTPYLRQILEAMERYSPYATLTLGRPRNSTLLLHDDAALIQLCFVDPVRKVRERDGIILAPRTPLPPQGDEDDRLLAQFAANDFGYLEEMENYE